MGLANELVSATKAVSGILSGFISWGNSFYILLGVAPTLLWLAFFLFEEKRQKKEPKYMISLVFLVGAVSALITLIVQMVVTSHLPPEYIKALPPTSYDPSIIAVVIFGIFALIEEVLKFSFVYITVRWSHSFDEPIDGMLHMITGALGFAALENIIFVASSPDPTSLMIFRFIGAILLHAMASGFMGFYWMRKKLPLGIAIATALHLAFNLTVLYIDDLIYFLSGYEVELGVAIGPFLLVIVSFFLFRDFDILKKQSK